MTTRYLEDFAVGQTFSSGRLRIDAEQITSFATAFDPQPFHLDEAAAEASVFKGLAASGWHIAAAAMSYAMVNSAAKVRFPTAKVIVDIDHRHASLLRASFQTQEVSHHWPRMFQ